ncbi:MAG TPA: type II toxin-antitoxin system VapB family antitoxin [Jatrophihabitantaceae bacterium]|nr:type II toxin-antitoxin system VapB family antitoxin [Jatrophihabitantaceae bacterium]
MSRTNIDIDDELIADVMRENNLRTKRDAVDFALRKARRRKPLTPEEIIELRGTGFWDGDLEAIKRSRVDHREGSPDE